MPHTMVDMILDSTVEHGYVYLDAYLKWVRALHVREVVNPYSYSVLNQIFVGRPNGRGAEPFIYLAS